MQVELKGCYILHAHKNPLERSYEMEESIHVLRALLVWTFLLEKD
jgi:hypothetical protein